MINRRQFIRTTAAVAATSALPAWSQPSEGGISLGFSLYGMKTLPIDQALATCAEIGYRNVELATNPGFPTEPKLLSATDRKNIAAQLEKHRLNLSAMMLNMSLPVNDATHAQNLENIKTVAQLAHDLSPAHPPLIETVLGGKSAEWEQIKEKMAEHLRSWAEAATQSQIVIAIKGHVSSAVDTPERLLWLVQQAHSPAIQVDFDYSHFQLAGFSLEDSLKPLLPYTKFIHVKDSVQEGKKFHFVLPGEGNTDYVAYFKLLQAQRYSGPVVVEVSAQVFNKPGYDPIAAARQSYAALSAALQKARA